MTCTAAFGFVRQATTAAVEGIVALTTACARARLATDEANHVKSRRKAALDHIDSHLGNARLGPDEIADAANMSRASLYRLLAAEGGIRAVLLSRRLDEALRLNALRPAAATVSHARPSTGPRLA